MVKMHFKRAKEDLLELLYKGNEEILDVLETWKTEKKAKELELII